MVEALVGRDAEDDLLAALAGDIDAPHLLDVEVLSVLRGLVLGGKLDPVDAVRSRRDYFAFTITRHETEPLAERIWQLRHRSTQGALDHMRCKTRDPRPQRRDPPRSANALICRNWLGRSCGTSDDLSTQ